MTSSSIHLSFQLSGIIYRSDEDQLPQPNCCTLCSSASLSSIRPPSIATPSCPNSALYYYVEIEYQMSQLPLSVVLPSPKHAPCSYRQLEDSNSWSSHFSTKSHWLLPFADGIRCFHHCDIAFYMRCSWHGMACCSGYSSYGSFTRQRIWSCPGLNELQKDNRLVRSHQKRYWRIGCCYSFCWSFCDSFCCQYLAKFDGYYCASIGLLCNLKDFVKLQQLACIGHLYLGRKVVAGLSWSWISLASCSMPSRLHWCQCCAGPSIDSVPHSLRDFSALHLLPASCLIIQCFADQYQGSQQHLNSCFPPNPRWSCF